MSTFFTVARANTYFAGHIHRSTWNSFADADKTAALTHAVRILYRAMYRAPYERVTTDTEMPREDLAVYEQAFSLLRNGPATSIGGVPGYVTADQANPQQPREQDVGLICQEARRWLAVPRVQGGPAAFVELGRG